MAEISGASLTAVTVSAKTLLDVRAPSLTVKVMLATPLAFATGVMVTVQFGAVPAITIPALASTAVLEEDPLTAVEQTRVLSISLIVKAKALDTVSSAVVLLVRVLIAGASLTAVTVNAKILFALRDPSLTVKVILADPLAFATGVIVTVQLGAVPPIAMPALASTAVFDEAPLTAVAQFNVLSISAMVKATALVAVSSEVD